MFYRDVLMIDEIRHLAQRRVESEAFMREFPLLVPAGNRHTNGRFVRVNLFDDAFLIRSLDEDAIAGF